MKKVFLAIAISIFPFVLFAQNDNDQELADGKFKFKGVSGLNFSQIAMSNWATGGENSLAGTAFLNGSAVRKQGNWLWTTTLALEYGLTRLESQGVRKVTDRIDLSTQLGYKINEKWYYTAMGSFRTQFAKGYNYSDAGRGEYISRFMAPGYSNLSLGIEYRHKDFFSAFFSPVAGKLTFVQDDSLSNIGAFGVDPGEKFKAELGAYLKSRIEKEIMKNVTLISTVDFFTAYDSSFGNVDINWDMLVNMKINKFLSANINTTLKYDDDVKSVDKEGNQRGPKVQFREVLGIGFAYNF